MTFTCMTLIIDRRLKMNRYFKIDQHKTSLSSLLMIFMHHEKSRDFECVMYHIVTYQIVTIVTCVTWKFI